MINPAILPLLESLIGSSGGAAAAAGGLGGILTQDQLAETLKNVMGPLFSGMSQGNKNPNSFQGLAGFAGTGPAGQKLGQSFDKLVDAATFGIGSSAIKVSKMIFDITPPGRLLKLATTAAELSFRIRDWSKELLNSQHHLMQFNSSIAATFIEGERRGILRDIRSGRRTAESTAYLGSNYQELSDVLQPFSDSVTNALNNIGGSLAGITTDALRFWGRFGYGIAKQIDALNKAVGLVSEKQEERKNEEADSRAAFTQFAKEVSEGKLPDVVEMP